MDSLGTSPIVLRCHGHYSRGADSRSIIFVHGLQGHPFRTWAQRQDSLPKAEKRGIKKRDILNFLRPRSSKSSVIKSASIPKVSTEYGREEEPGVSDSSQMLATFWPGELLPPECPDARILTWGYDTMVTKGLKAPADKTNIFAHGKKFLYSLGRNRDVRRPIIFVAHSLGGIVVKEVHCFIFNFIHINAKKLLQMLANSDVAEDEDLKSIVESTAAVIFLGTPHRGSKDMASVGEIARKAASIICDTSTASLDALGLKTSDLERCQEAFSRLWRAHDFRVKTFQESTGLTSLNVGLLNEKVCPLYLNAVTLGGVLPGPCLLMKPPGCA